MEQMQGNNEAMKQEEISLKEFILRIQNWLNYLRRKWFFLLVSLVVGGLLGFTYSKFSKDVFTASTTFVIEGGESGNSSIGQYAGLASMIGVDLGSMGGGVFQGDNLLELYKSRKMIEAALLTNSISDSSKLLLDYYLDFNELKENWKKYSPDLLEINFRNNDIGIQQRSRDSILQYIIKDINKTNLTVSKPDKKLSIIHVDVKSKNEIFSKEFNKALVDVVNTFYVKTKTKKSLENIEILQYKTDSVRAVMNGAISAAVVAIDNTPNLNPTKQAQRIVPSQRSQFSAETNKAILGHLVQNLEMSKMTLLKESPLIQVIDEPIYPLHKDKVSTLKAIVIGGFIVFVLMLSILSVQKMYKNIVN